MSSLHRAASTSSQIARHAFSRLRTNARAPTDPKQTARIRRWDRDYRGSRPGSRIKQDERVRLDNPISTRLNYFVVFFSRDSTRREDAIIKTTCRGNLFRRNLEFLIQSIFSAYVFFNTRSSMSSVSIITRLLSTICRPPKKRELDLLRRRPSAVDFLLSRNKFFFRKTRQDFSLKMQQGGPR